jgi:hypothetical protein
MYGIILILGGSQKKFRMYAKNFVINIQKILIDKINCSSNYFHQILKLKLIKILNIRDIGCINYEY